MNRRPPYVRFVMPNDGVQMPVPTIQWDETNGAKWATSVHHYLMYTGATHFINNDLRPEMHDPTFRMWQQDEIRMIGLVMSLIKDDYKQRFMDCKTAKEIYDRCTSKNVSSEAMNVLETLNQMSSLNVIELSANDYCNEWNTILDRFAGAGNKLTEATKIAMMVQFIPDSMSSI